MAYVQIPKDLKTIKSTVVLNLTLRQLIGFIIAGVLSIPIYLFTKNIMGNDIAMILLMAIAFPILFVTFYEKNGLKAEEYLKNIYIFKYHQPAKRVRKEEYLKLLKKREELERRKNKKK